MRIQTIHSFCAALLRRFPLEAGVSPQFTELDARSARLLREEIVEEMSDHLAPEVMGNIALAFRGDAFAKLIEEVATNRSGFAGPLELSTLFDMPKGESAARILGDTFLGAEPTWMPRLIEALGKGSTTDNSNALRLMSVAFDSPELGDLTELEDLFLYGKKAISPFGAKVGAFPTKPTQKRLPDIMPALNDLMQRVEAARPRRLTFAAAQKTETLHEFASVFLPIYAERKAARGWLDFDDLITRAKALLTNPSVAAWVLYRLDSGIDHVLVDEAQDTSPDQWRVIELLTAEFTAGEGTRSGGRTLFVVGDKKQSIYSFQGADVAAFDAKHADFRDRFGAAQQRFQSRNLEYSFRSSPAILQLVDQALGTEFPQALGQGVVHRAIKDQLPGRVDLWPLIAKEKDATDDKFEDPVDLIRESHESVRLARKLAAEIRRMIDDGVQIPARDGARPVHAGDFLILVQRRSDLFPEIIRACKAEDLPIAGADRLKLGAELAVKDLAALLSFLATPEDDLSLAVTLRSPLLGWTEGELYDLAHGRPGYLWQALREQADKYPQTLDYLNDLRLQTDFLSPYDLIERALTRHDGRRRLIARLGPEAEDGIDELLNQALGYERGEVPSLTGFLARMETDDIEVKRQTDSAGGRIRVMTVHGAKGLESEIVILPDTANRNPPERNELLVAPAGQPIWKVAVDDSPPLIAALRFQKQLKAAEESTRLLYVALTRARCWLIVAGAGTADKDSAWHQIVDKAMMDLGAKTCGDGLRHEAGHWPEPIGRNEAVHQENVALPDWAEARAPAADRPIAPRSPTALGGAKALPDEGGLTEDAAKARGAALHLLLQHLPGTDEASWPSLSRHLIADETLRADVIGEARSVLCEAQFASLFGPNSLAEVPVTGTIHGQRFFGIIDRLVIAPDHILAVDFKSNAVVATGPDQVPEGLLRQMGAYFLLLEQIYPGRAIRTAILWTRAPQLMPLNADIVRDASLRATMDSSAGP